MATMPPKTRRLPDVPVPPSFSLLSFSGIGVPSGGIMTATVVVPGDGVIDWGDVGLALDRCAVGVILAVG